MTTDTEVERTADISQDGIYRYGLFRKWSEDNPSFATFIMLNPSTADAVKDDRTVSRCMDFARSWGMGGLHVLNVYALRSPYPADLWRSADPVGPENDRHLAAHAQTHAESGWPFVAAWGVNAKPERVRAVLALPGMSVALQSLGVTKSGAPRHPLYLRADTQRSPWPQNGATP